MAVYYCAVLLGLPLLYICSCNAEIGAILMAPDSYSTLHSSPELIVTVKESNSAAVFCWTIYDAGTSISLKLEHEGSPLLLNNDDSLIKPASGTCNQNLVPNGKNCENITATIPGNMSLDRTTLTCYLVDVSTLARRDETLDVTIVVIKSTTPDCNCTCGTAPTTTTATASTTSYGDSIGSTGSTNHTEIQTGSDFKIPLGVVTVALGFSIVVIIILTMALYKALSKTKKENNMLRIQSQSQGNLMNDSI